MATPLSNQTPLLNSYQGVVEPPPPPAQNIRALIQAAGQQLPDISPTGIASHFAFELSKFEQDPQSFNDEAKTLMFRYYIGPYYDRDQYIELCKQRNDYSLLIHVAKLKISREHQEADDVLTLLSYSGLDLNKKWNVVQAFVYCMDAYGKKNQYAAYYSLLRDQFERDKLDFLYYCIQLGDPNVFNAWLDFGISQRFASNLFNDSTVINVEFKYRFLASPLAKLDDSRISLGVWNSLFNDATAMSKLLDVSLNPAFARIFMLLYTFFPVEAVKLAGTVANNPDSFSLFDNAIFSKSEQLTILEIFISSYPGHFYPGLLQLLKLMLERSPSHVVVLCWLIEWEIKNNTNAISNLFFKSSIVSSYLVDVLDIVKLKSNRDGYLKLFSGWNSLSVEQVTILLQSFQNAADSWSLSYLENISAIIRLDPECLNNLLSRIQQQPRHLFILIAVGGLGTSSICRELSIPRLKAVIAMLGEPGLPLDEMTNLLVQFANGSLCNPTGIGDCIYYALQTNALKVYRIFREVPHPYRITCWHLLAIVSGHDCFAFIKKNVVTDLGKKFHKIYNPAVSLDNFLEPPDRRFKMQLNELLRQGKIELAQRILHEYNTRPENQQQTICRILDECLDYNMEDELAYLLEEFCIAPQSQFVELLIDSIGIDHPRFVSLFADFRKLKIQASQSQGHAKVLLELAMKNVAENFETRHLLILIELYCRQTPDAQYYFARLYPLVDTPRLQINQRCALMALQNGDKELAMQCLRAEGSLSSLNISKLWEVKSFFRGGDPTLMYGGMPNFDCGIDGAIIQRHLDMKDRLKASSLTLEARFHGESIIITYLFVTSVVISNGVINTDLLDKITSSVNLDLYFDSVLLDNIVTRLKKLRTHPAIRIALENIKIGNRQNGPIAFLTRATLGIPRNHLISDVDVMVMVFMAYLNYSRQPEDVSSCVGVGRLGMLLDNDPLYFIRLIDELCETDKVVINKTDCFLGLMPSTSDLENYFVYDLSTENMEGFANTPLPIWQMPQLINIAVYFQIPDSLLPDSPYKQWIRQSIQQCPKTQVDSDKIRIKQRDFTRLLAEYVGLYSQLQFKPLLETIKYEVRILYLAPSHSLLTRAIEGLFITMDPTCFEETKVIIEGALKTAIESTLGINTISDLGSIGNGVFEFIKNDIQTELTNVFDCSVIPVRNVLVPSSKVLKRPPHTLHSKQKLIEFLKTLIEKNINKVSEIFVRKKLILSNYKCLEKKKNELLNLIEGNDFAIKLFKDFQSRIQTNPTHSPWNLPSGAITEKITKVTSTQKAKRKKYITLSAEDLLALLFEFIEIHDVDKPVNGKKTGRMPGHAINFLFNDSSLSELRENPREHVQTYCVKPARKIHDKLMLDYEAYRSICEKMEATMPLPILDRWKSLSLIPQDDYTDQSLGATRAIMYSNLVEATGSPQMVTELYESLLDNHLFSHIKASRFQDLIYYLKFIDSNWVDVSSELSICFCLIYSPMTLSWELWKVLQSEENPNPLKFEAKSFFQLSKTFDIYQ